jgi:putative membrane protein
MRAEALLQDDGFARIEAAIQEAESRTSGEIVFLVADRSDPYLAPRVLFATALAFAAGVACLASPLAPAVWLPALQAATFGLGCAASAHPALLRRLLPAEWRRAQVERAAGVAFLQHDLANTRERTGVLIYLSLLEHQVVVLADRGIDARVAPGTWSEVVERILAGIRAGEAERGLADGVQRCGDILAAHFPPGADNPDELPNPVLR